MLAAVALHESSTSTSRSHAALANEPGADHGADDVDADAHRPVREDAQIQEEDRSLGKGQRGVVQHREDVESLVVRVQIGQLILRRKVSAESDRHPWQ